MHITLRVKKLALILLLFASGFSVLMLLLFVTPWRGIGLPYCPQIDKDSHALKGKQLIQRKTIDVDTRVRFNYTKLLSKLHAKHAADMSPGGAFKPFHGQCTPRQHIAILIPCHERYGQLFVWLDLMLPKLKRQQHYFQIFVVDYVNKDEKFPKGLLFNVAYHVAQQTHRVELMQNSDFADDFTFTTTKNSPYQKTQPFDCIFLHDVDLIAENDRNIYECDMSTYNPTHYSFYIDKFGYRQWYGDIFGGVVSIRPETYEMINGFSNLYWGWGGEDDDLLKRLRNKHLNFTRPSFAGSREILKYTMLKHTHQQVYAGDRFILLNNSHILQHFDGYSSIKNNYAKYTIVPNSPFENANNQLFTLIKLSISENDYKSQQYLQHSKNTTFVKWMLQRLRPGKTSFKEYDDNT